MNSAASTARRQTAATALLATAAGASVLLASAPAPWMADVAMLSGPPAPPTAWPLPLVDAFSRGAAVIRTLQLGLCVALAWAGYQVFRGPGRGLAAASAGLSTAAVASLSDPWVHGPPASIAAATLLTLAIGTILRALVHFGCIPPASRLRALALSAAAFPQSPAATLPVLALLLGVCALRARPRHHPGEPARAFRGTFTLASWALSATAIAVAGAVWAVRGTPDVPLASYALTWPELSFAPGVPTAIAYPALSLVVVLVAPLRWRGGLTLLAVVVGALSIRVGDELAAPVSARVALACGAASGWVWLMGSWLRSRPALARYAAAASAVVVVVLARSGIPPAAPDTTVSALPDRSYRALLTRGLMAPGDEVWVFHPWTLQELRAWQAHEGFRPDVLVHRGQDATNLPVLTREAAAAGHRPLSDSFTAGGAWDPARVADSGPLFWHVGDQGTSRNDFIALDAFTPAGDAPLPPALARRFEALHVERARFWRRRGLPDEALRALPLRRDELEMLTAARRRAAGQRPRAVETTELAQHLTAVAHADPGALLWAEAGDLLMASGADDVGAALLVRASELGHPEALAALARWRLRASSRFESRELLATLAAHERHRHAAASLVRWLADRGRLDEARALLDAFAPHPGHAAEEAAARLRVVTGGASRPARAADPPRGHPGPRSPRRTSPVPP